MDRIYSPSALYPQTLEPQLKLGTADVISTSFPRRSGSRLFFFFLRTALPNRGRVFGIAEFRWTTRKTQRETKESERKLKKTCAVGEPPA